MMADDGYYDPKNYLHDLVILIVRGLLYCRFYKPSAWNVLRETVIRRSYLSISLQSLNFVDEFQRNLVLDTTTLYVSR